MKSIKAIAWPSTCSRKYGVTQSILLLIGIPRVIETYKIGIKLLSEDVVNEPSFRRSEVEKNIINSKVDELMEAGFVTHSNSEYSSPVFLVKNNDGGYRMVVNYKKLKGSSVHFFSFFRNFWRLFFGKTVQGRAEIFQDNRLPRPVNIYWWNDKTWDRNYTKKSFVAVENTCHNTSFCSVVCILCSFCSFFLGEL